MKTKLVIHTDTPMDLPDGVQVRGGLLTSLRTTELPENMKISGMLYIISSEINELPRGLIVESLILMRCHSLWKIPEDLRVLKEIVISSTTQAKTNYFPERLRHLIKTIL